MWLCVYPFAPMQRFVSPVSLLLCAIILVTQLAGVHAHLVYDEEVSVGHQATTPHNHSGHDHHPHGAMHAVAANDGHHDAGQNLSGHVDIDSAEAPAGKIPTPSLLGLVVLCAYLLTLLRTRTVLKPRSSSPPHTRHRIWLLHPPSQAPPLSI